MIELAAAMKQLRELHRSDRRDSAPIFAKVRQQVSRVHDRLDAHNALEEAQVYHWAGAFLDGSQQKVLNEKLQQELNYLPARFRDA